MTKKPAIFIYGDRLTFQQFAEVVFNKAPVELSDCAIERMEASQKYVAKLLSDERAVYGISTGFGKLCDVLIAPEEVHNLQHNLLKSHACGVGEPLPEEVVRGTMLLRINALAKGFSGIRPSVVQMLISLLNHEVHPVIPSQGSLGASGDLAPLSHMCLPLIGLGDVIHDGHRIPAKEALARLGMKPIRLEAKEGLALINGTQMMCSIGALAVLYAENLLKAADIIAAMTVEALEGIPDAFHPLIQQVRGHYGQIVTAKNMLALLAESGRTTRPGEKRVQDAYSLRCIPQVHGASKDAYHYAAKTIVQEMNAATDNPLIFASEGEVISGGNFHGQPLALTTDFLAIALAEIANISERRTERLVNPQLSGLPPFLSARSGLHSGYMIMQYVAASLVSENKTLAHPASVDSIPSSANQEDHVSMGSISARKCLKIIENVTNVLAIEYLCAAQALEFSSKSCGRGTLIARELLRRHVPPLDDDREGHAEINIAAHLIKSGSLVKAVAERLDLQI
ncbi:MULTISPECIES: histidine ammonia-lyase [unclassified Thermoactinomyces]|jgi:histidine ammonia-lyase|uniref:histidine ammonia-lyase n=1 Tax=unclassified Thermoactinomyces TaxID=2634588 RepID=UPI0018DBC22F|nr:MULTISPECIES: histidine ammonia-lyase [unclassified Thermoactinomyces]MBH8596777.1 histidine ammonia-lyase [Thermoactinomyces sp. CICC 10523]MBH8603538.1 histidine ammonia-lyase [Thermoactinomyces sp. CICC 10522]MBH8606702.1 histidine ammonia-lyase [Thermoactinomyces sp. CICC 10521]